MAITQSDPAGQVVNSPFFALSADGRVVVRNGWSVGGTAILVWFIDDVIASVRPMVLPLALNLSEPTGPVTITDLSANALSEDGSILVGHGQADATTDYGWLIRLR